MRTGLIAAAAVAAVGVGIGIGVALHGDSSSGTKGSGTLAAETRSVPAFTKVRLEGATAVRVRVAPKREVVVAGDDNLLKRIETNVENGTLVISQRGSFTTKAPTSVDVATPTLDGVDLAGAGTIDVTGVDAKRFDAVLGGAGRLDVDGSATDLETTVSGVGAAQLEHLLAQRARVVMSGTGSAHVWAVERLDAIVSGTGSVRYGGKPPVVHQQVTGVGTVIAE